MEWCSKPTMSAKIMAIPLAPKRVEPEDAFARSISSRIAGGQLKPIGDPQVGYAK